MADLVNRAEQQKTARIRELNDAFRRTFIGGLVVLTRGVSELPEGSRAAVINAVQGFGDDAFVAADDPYGEHDFIAFDVEGQTYFAKIDYYGLTMSVRSEDPADPKKTSRVITIMRADEY